ncbi:MAG: ADP-ribosylglycohydrolase family protein [Victivallaceae bacterium]|nr:ADP-ribosylglycohydrolase family protein [Victivallaceae bacterium]
MKNLLNAAEYRDKVYGCWTGKNIGGTLGGPLEGRRDFFNIDFYTQKMTGEPLPNDDLDLQLIWLLAVEEQGVYHLNERILGEYWLNYIIGPWNEYGVGKTNIGNGFFPPLSGAYNNEQWKNSNGAWIRSEIWACLFPGNPDEAVAFAWMDSCVDHAGDGIYAELFTTALESAAFLESDISVLLEIALSKIPPECRVARSVRLAIKSYQEKRSLEEARNLLVSDSADLGWFQAPCNVGFTVLGLLYGEGDLGRTICAAVNCGDDTDCTGATAGAVFGIIQGRAKLPSRWIEPIGESIRTVAINPYRLAVPKTLAELTDRVLWCKKQTEMLNPELVALTEGATAISPECRKALCGAQIVRDRIWNKPSMAQIFDLPYGQLQVEYLSAAEAIPGEVLKMRLTERLCRFDCRTLNVEWLLPEGWEANPGPEQALLIEHDWKTVLEFELKAGEFSGAFEYIPLKVTVSGRPAPIYLTVPFGLRGAVRNDKLIPDVACTDCERRRNACRREASSRGN